MTQQPQTPQPRPAERKPYQRPRILHEMPLETRAGSPLSIPSFELPGMGETK